MLTLRRCELRNGGGRGTLGFDMFDRLRSRLLAMPLYPNGSLKRPEYHMDGFIRLAHSRIDFTLYSYRSPSLLQPGELLFIDDALCLFPFHLIHSTFIAQPGIATFQSP